MDLRWLSSFGGNLSDVVMEFKLVNKNNTEVAVCCSGINKYSIEDHCGGLCQSEGTCI